MAADKGILEIDKDLNKGEHLLPVHFLPVGNRCYDWVKQDVEESEEDDKKNQFIREEDKPPDTCKGKDSTVNSVVYSNAHISGGLSETSEKVLVQKLLSGAEKGDLETVKEILKTNPLIVNKTDSDGYTALHRASYSGHLEMVELLLQRGGNIHSTTDDGWQPLHCAVRWNNLEISKRLIAKKANVNALTKGRQTPLHFASISSESQPTLEMLLLQPGIDIHIANAAGDTPYDIARRSGLQYKLFDMVSEGLNI